MPAAIDNTVYSVDEVAFLTQMVVTEEVMNQNAAVALGRNDCPTYNILMSKAQRRRALFRSGMKFNVKGQRGQSIVWWDGADVLRFESHVTPFQLLFKCGRAHYGDEVLFTFLQNMGYPVDYSATGVRMGAHEESSVMRLCNFIKENAEDIVRDWDYGMAKHLWSANAAHAKCFVGIDSLIPIANPTTGLIGGLSRANPLLQHNVATGLTKDTIRQNFNIVRRAAEDRCLGHKLDIISAGDDVIEVLEDLYFGTSALFGKLDFRQLSDKAAETAGGLNIGIDARAWEHNGTIITREPMFNDLQAAEGPTFSWKKRIYGLCSKFLFPVPSMDRTAIPHPMPYNQRLQRTSYHGELFVACTNPQAQFVMAVA